MEENKRIKIMNLISRIAIVLSGLPIIICFLSATVISVIPGMYGLGYTLIIPGVIILTIIGFVLSILTLILESIYKVDKKYKKTVMISFGLVLAHIILYFYIFNILKILSNVH